MKTKQSQTKKELEASNQNLMVENWNLKHPVGSEVVVKLDNGSLRETRTRSEAWLLGGHTAVVMVNGISGGYLLDRVRHADGAFGVDWETGSFGIEDSRRYGGNR